MSTTTRCEAIPARFTGTWRRRSIAFDGGEPHEPATVVWVQSSSDYADLRVPVDGVGDPPKSFAGRVRWDGRCLRWSREVDLDDRPGAEVVGRVWFEDGLLLEAGTFQRRDGPRAYVQVWERQPGSDGTRLALRREDGRGRLVRAGDHALTIVDQRPLGGAYRACYRVRTGDGWTIAASLGPDAEQLPEPPALHALDVGRVTIDAKRWLVVEASEATEAA